MPPDEIQDIVSAEELIVQPGVETGAPVEAPPVEAPTEEQEIEGLSEHQVSNWKALRLARDAEAERANQTQAEYEAFRQKFEPIEPVLDQIVELGDLLAPSDPDPAAISAKIREFAPMADRHLAGYYLEQWGDWFIQQATGGAASSVAELQALAQRGFGGSPQAPAPTAPNQLPATGMGKLSEQLEFLDDDVRQDVEARLARLQALEERVQRVEETERQKWERQQTEDFESKKTAYAQERVGQIDELLKLSKVEPMLTTPEGTQVPNSVYADLKRLTVVELMQNPVANDALIKGQEARARGQKLEEGNQTRALARIVTDTFKAVAERHLTPRYQQQVQQTQANVQKSQAQPGNITGGQGAPSAPQTPREYSSDPAERRQQLLAKIKPTWKQ